MFYICNDCGAYFTQAALDTFKGACPECNSTDVKEQRPDYEGLTRKVREMEKIGAQESRYLSSIQTAAMAIDVLRLASIEPDYFLFHSKARRTQFEAQARSCRKWANHGAHSMDTAFILPPDVLRR